MKAVTEVPLIEIAEGIFDGPHATPPESQDGPVFLRLDNITPEGRLDLTDLRYINQADFPKWTCRVKPEAGDVVFSYEATLHRYVEIPEGFHGCLGRRLALIRPNRRKIEPRYLLYYFLSPRWRSVAGSAVINGATVDRISLTRVWTLPVRLPSLNDQRRIVDILSAYDDLIESNRRRMALLEESARLLYQEWFVRLRFPGHEHTPITNGIPKGWQRLSIAALVERDEVDLQTGPFGTQLKASDYSESGAPVINVRNIGFGELRPEKLEFVPEEVVERLQQHVLRAGDIVFGRKGAVDRHLLIRSTQEGWIQGSDCIRMRSCSSRISTLLMSLAFRESPHKQWMITQCSNKATMASLNQEVLGRIEAMLPSQLILDEFVNIATDAFGQIGNLWTQNERLRAARDLLLPRLMSGEVKV